MAGEGEIASSSGLLPAVCQGHSRGCFAILIGIAEQRIRIQEKWRQRLTCTIFCPELLNVLTCWGMPFEDAVLKGADVRIIANQKRLNVLPRC